MKSNRAIKEVITNLGSRPALTAATLIIAGLLGFGSAIWEIDTAAEIQAQWEDQLSLGSSTVRVVDANGELLSGSRCDALNAQAGVLAAGAIVNERVVYSYGNPRAIVTIDEATPGLIAVTFPQEANAGSVGILAGREISDTYELTNGGLFLYRTSPTVSPTSITIERVASHRASIPGSGTAIFVAVSPNADVNECLVRIAPDFQESVRLVISGWFDGQNVVIAPLLSSDSTRANPEHAIQVRPTRFVGIGSGLILSMWVFSMWWMRRGEQSLYRLLGVRYRQLILMASTETVLTLLVPFSMGVFAAMVANWERFVPITLAIFPWDVIQALPILALVPWLAVIPVRLADPLKILREG